MADKEVGDSRRGQPAAQRAQLLRYHTLTPADEGEKSKDRG